MYTDPQMHTIDRIGFGKGNLGIKGIEKFLQTHRCSAVCRYLKLPSINAKQYDVGTIPSTRYMSPNAVEVENFALPPHAAAQQHAALLQHSRGGNPSAAATSGSGLTSRQISYSASLGILSNSYGVLDENEKARLLPSQQRVSFFFNLILILIDFILKFTFEKKKKKQIR